MINLIKTTVVAVAICATQSINAQFAKVYDNDKFGEPTGKAYRSALFEGLMSNSATTNSRAVLRATLDLERDNKEYVLMEIYEYGNKSAKAWFGNDITYGEIYLKTPLDHTNPDGTINVAKFDAGFYKKGIILKGKEAIEFTKFMEINGVYKLLIEKPGKYSTSKYLFTLEIDDN